MQTENEIQVSHKELEKMIDIAYYTKSKVPMYIWGTIGIGKSDMVKTTTEKLSKKENRTFVIWNKLSKDEKYDVLDNVGKYFILWDYRLSSRDSTDLMGLPNLNGKDAVEWKIPLWLLCACKKDAKGVIFFDELNLAVQSIQTSAYQLIRDRCIGEVALADGVSVLSAGNRMSDKANVYDLPKPLQNRFIHCILKPPTVDDWIEWGLKHNVDTRIMVFLKFKEDMLMKFEPTSRDKAFPTPRSWGEYCNELIQGVTDDMMLELLVTSAVGTGASLEFCSFLKAQEKLDLNKVLNNPESVRELSIDLKYSLMHILSNWWKKNNTVDDTKILLRVIEQMESEFAIMTLNFTRAVNKVVFRNRVLKIDLWTKGLGQQYGKFLYESDVINNED